MAPAKPSYTGLGHGAAKRHRSRALQADSIRGITKPDIRRLARRGGVRRIKVEIYDTVRDALKKRLQEMLQKVVYELESTGRAKNTRKTVSSLDIIYALRIIGSPLYGFHEIK